jgi:hypothetical protein
MEKEEQNNSFWTNLNIMAVAYGFGWKKINEATTYPIHILLEELNERVGKMNEMLEARKKERCENCFFYGTSRSGMSGFCTNESIGLFFNPNFYCANFKKKGK